MQPHILISCLLSDFYLPGPFFILCFETLWQETEGSSKSKHIRSSGCILPFFLLCTQTAESLLKAAAAWLGFLMTQYFKLFFKVQRDHGGALLMWWIGLRSYLDLNASESKELVVRIVNSYKYLGTLYILKLKYVYRGSNSLALFDKVLHVRTLPCLLNTGVV